MNILRVLGLDRHSVLERQFRRGYNLAAGMLLTGIEVAEVMQLAGEHASERGVSAACHDFQQLVNGGRHAAHQRCTGASHG